MRSFCFRGSLGCTTFFWRFTYIWTARSARKRAKLFFQTFVLLFSLFSRFSANVNADEDVNEKSLLKMKNIKFTLQTTVRAAKCPLLMRGQRFWWTRWSDFTRFNYDSCWTSAALSEFDGGGFKAVRNSAARSLTASSHRPKLGWTRFVRVFHFERFCVLWLVCCLANFVTKRFPSILFTNFLSSWDSHKFSRTASPKEVVASPATSWHCQCNCTDLHWRISLDSSRISNISCFSSETASLAGHFWNFQHL